MKNAAIVITLLTILPTIVSAQTPSRQRLSPESSTQSESNSTRTRVVGPKVSNHAETTKARPAPTQNVTSASRTEAKPPQFVWGNTAIASRTEDAVPSTPAKNTVVSAIETAPMRTVVQPTIMKVNSPTTPPRVVTSPVSPTPAAMYAVGSGDVLDIRLSNTPARESTLFTVLKNGAIEYPLLDRPLVVNGLTTDEIARMLVTQIKVIRTARVSVSVRDYASHRVVISGLVDNPGTKILRRQSMPLFALLAEASVRPEATTVTIVRNGIEGTPVSLKDDQALATLISSGDAIRISGGNAPAGQFVYVGGDVAMPGEKSFRAGMTMTQALLSAGASVSSTRTVKVSRRNAGGLLSTSEYDIASIAQGKTPDPPVFPGDRIEVKRAK